MMIGSDSAALLVIIELRQRIAALEDENAELRSALDPASNHRVTTD